MRRCYWCLKLPRKAVSQKKNLKLHLYKVEAFLILYDLYFECALIIHIYLPPFFNRGVNPYECPITFGELVVVIGTRSCSGFILFEDPGADSTADTFTPVRCK